MLIFFFFFIYFFIFIEFCLFRFFFYFYNVVSYRIFHYAAPMRYWPLNPYISYKTKTQILGFWVMFTETTLYKLFIQQPYLWFYSKITFRRFSFVFFLVSWFFPWLYRWITYKFTFFCFFLWIILTIVYTPFMLRGLVLIDDIKLHGFRWPVSRIFLRAGYDYDTFLNNYIYPNVKIFNWYYTEFKYLLTFVNFFFFYFFVFLFLPETMLFLERCFFAFESADFIFFFRCLVSVLCFVIIFLFLDLLSSWAVSLFLRLHRVDNFFSSQASIFDFLVVRSRCFKNWNILSIALFKSRILQFCDNTFIEVYWASVPALILVLFVMLPSFSLLYFLDQKIPYEGSIPNDILTIKVIGRQWYWDYESIGFDPVTLVIKKCYFSSYMISAEDLYLGELRLLQVDNLLVLPRFKTIRFLITSADVIHSWSVPALGIKVDACPGRLNQVWTYVSKPGIFYGQCSEICGANHPFMPIMIQVF